MKHKTRVAAAVVGGLIAAGAGAGLAFADLSGSISLTNTNISFSGSYQYNVYWDSISTGVKVSGTLKSAKTDSGYLNGRQQGYGWTRLGYVDIGKSVAVSKLIGPATPATRRTFG